MIFLVNFCAIMAKRLFFLEQEKSFELLDISENVIGWFLLIEKGHRFSDD